MRSLRLIATVIALLLRNLTSCPEVRFTWVNDGLSVILHSVDAEMIPTSVPRTGRAAYLSPDGFGLFHTVDWSSGRGSWQFGNVTDLANPLAAADSYAVLPHLVNSAYFMLPAISSGWKGTYHESARSLNIAVECTSSAHGAVFLQSSQLQADLSGFYIRQYSIQSTTPLFRQVTGPNEQKPKYLFPLLPPGRCESEGCQTTWLVGDEPFVDAGLAFTKVARVVSEADGAESVADDLIKAALAGSLRWHFVVTPEGEAQFPWVEDPEARLVAAAPGEDLYLALERERQSYRDPQSPSYRGPSQSSQPYLLLGSGVPMPQVGLGTGGIWAEAAPEVFRSALQIGYRLFDLAREYGNEHIMGAALRASGVDRREVFLQTKVWPTQLGFGPTGRAIDTSLRELGVAYIDNYMLHWPRCDSDVEWMRCWDTEEPAATWRESYRALERAHAEGRVRSIGVSNFDASLLRELEDSVATVLPHVVQNWAEPGRTDEAVRRWCASHGAVYQPYAPLRNLHLLSRDLRAALRAIAERRNTTEHTVVLQFFLQLGTSVIPRSTRWEHLQQNLRQRDWSLSEEELMLLAGGPLDGPDL